MLRAQCDGQVQDGNRTEWAGCRVQRTVRGRKHVGTIRADAPNQALLMQRLPNKRRVCGKDFVELPCHPCCKPLY